MGIRIRVRTTFAAIAAVVACQAVIVHAQEVNPSKHLSQNARIVELAPKSGDEVSRHTIRMEDEPVLSESQKLELMRKHIKYVFVLFRENRSFDFYFGTYPGARGLFSQSAADTPGITQPIVSGTWR